MVLYKDELKLVLCALGIYTAYIWYGLCQEDLYKQPFGPDKHRFTYSIFILLVQSVVSAFAAFLALVLTGKSPRHHTPIFEYGIQAATQCLATYFSSYALQFVDYPTQVLAKSCKPIPVMLMGVLLLHKRQSLYKYAYVSIITLGIILFMMEQSKGKPKEEKEQSIEGLLLLAGSLALDGITGPLQERLNHAHHPTPHHLMLYSNLWSVLFLGIAGFFSGELLPALNFCLEYPHVMKDVLILATTAAIGQQFIYYAIENVGSLNCSVITTSRKFWTLLVSVVWNNHPLSNRQWGGVILVFVGLGLDILASRRNRHHRVVQQHGDQRNHKESHPHNQ